MFPLRMSSLLTTSGFWVIGSGPLFSHLQRRVQSLHEILHHYRFREISEEPRLHSLGDVARHRVCAQGYDGYVGRQRVSTKDLQGVYAAHSIQVYVHQNDLRQGGAGEPDTEGSVHRGQESKVGTQCNELLNKLQVRRVVLNVEYRTKGRARPQFRPVRWRSFSA